MLHSHKTKNVKQKQYFNKANKDFRMVEKILWRRKWQPTLVFLPGESHEQSSLAGYSPWDRKSQT